MQWTYWYAHISLDVEKVFLFFLAAQNMAFSRESTIIRIKWWLILVDWYESVSVTQNEANLPDLCI